MAYDEGLAQRVRGQFSESRGVEDKKMFGGLCFMLSNHMACGIVGDTLMARVGRDNYQGCLNQASVRKMYFTGKVMKGMLYVDPQGIESDSEQAYWLNTCIAFVESLPPKKPK